MSPIRTIIVDDEPLARRGIRQLLASHGDITVVAEARNGLEAISTVRSLRPDLLFLDVQMPGTDGFGVLEQLGPTDLPFVIFVTAYDEFAVKAFETNALDYLVKPITEVRFAEALNRVRNGIKSNEAVAMSQKLASLLLERKTSEIQQRLLVPTATGELLLNASEIDWIEADDYYAAIHVGKKRHLIRDSLASLEQRLDRRRFFRTHRSAIVNIERVREILTEGQDMLLVLNDGQRVPVSRRKRELVKEYLQRLKV